MRRRENVWGVIYCPKHEFWNVGKRWKRICRCFENEHIDFDFVQSENADSVERLVKMMVNNDYKTIIIVGGDSALNDAVNCLMQFDSKIRNEVSLGVIPNGLMNDFAHFWGVKEGAIEENISCLKQHRIRKIDVGYIKYKNKKDEDCRRYFLNCVNIGLVATIMNLRRQTRHILGSRTLSFLFSFVLLIFQRLEYKMHVKINTDEISRNVMTLCIGNAMGYGQTPSAVPYNGQLDVSVVYHPAFMQVLEGIYLFVRGKFLNHRSVHPFRTRKVEIVNASKALVGVDGRLISTPVGSYTVSVETESLNFIIPV